MTEEDIALREKAERARFFYKVGKISRAKAKEEIQPYIETVNKMTEELETKTGIQMKRVSFAQYVR